MFETSSLRPGESDRPRSLRDRVADAFRSQPQAGLGITTTSGSASHPENTGNATEPDVTTRLLNSYDHVDPACGDRRCSHGTFSPRVEDHGRQGYIGQFDGLGNNRHGASAGLGGLPRGIDDHPESSAESETFSQLKSSSVLSVNDTRKQYVWSFTNRRQYQGSVQPVVTDD